jgi:hypothetical protein
MIAMLKKSQPLEDLARIARERVDVPSLEERCPQLSKARAEMADLDEKYRALQKRRAAHDAALQDARYRTTDANDPEAVALQRQDVSKHRAEMTKIDAELPVIREKYAQARALADAAVAEARKLILDDVRPIHLELVRRAFLSSLAPFAEAIVASEFLNRLLVGLEVNGVGFGNLPPRALTDSYLPVDRLRDDARGLIESGVIKPADLPRGVAEAWGFA